MVQGFNMVAEMKHKINVLRILLVVAILIMAIATFSSLAGEAAKKPAPAEPFRLLSSVYLTAGTSGARDYSSMANLPFEVVRVEFYDGSWLELTSLQEHKSPGAYSIIKISRVLFNRSMLSVSRIIHNHPGDPSFSVADEIVLFALRENGFSGEFGVIYKGSLYFMEDRAAKGEKE